MTSRPSHLSTCVICVALLGPACFDDPATSTSTGETSGDGDGDPTTTGDGDGDPTTTGDGDGDGDGDPTTTGDGDGDGDPTTTGDGDGDGDPTTTGEPDPVCDDGIVAPGELCYVESEVLPAGDAVYSGHYGRVNGDANLDVVYLLSDGTIVYHLGDGSGAFAGGADMSLTIGGGPMLTTRLDGDDRVDLVTVSNTQVQAMLGNGSGAFFESGLGDLSGPATALALGHIDANASPDVVSVAGSSIRVDLNDGGGGFAGPPGVANNGIAPITAIGVADFTGDNFGDAAIGTAEGIVVRPGNGQTIAFNNLFETGIGVVVTALAIGDLNGDDEPDIACTSNADNSIHWARGVGAGAFLGNVDRMIPGGPRSIVFRDLDGDGFDDLAVGTDDGRVFVLRSDGEGDVSNPLEVPLSIPATQLFADGDANGDGIIDLIATDPNSEGVALILSMP